MHLTHRQTCRVCGSKALTPVINLGLQHLQGSFVKLGREMPPNRRIPCELVRCDPTRDENACGLLQMRHSVPPEILYSSYWYVSGTNQTMRDHLAGIAKSAIEICPSGSVLDIGCNDLTLLNCFPKTWNCFGIDPSDVKPNADSGEIKVVRDLFPSRKLGREKFDIITSIAMFYDLEDPVNFAENIRSYLKRDGVWIVEMAYLPTMLANNSYDTICFKPDTLILGGNKPISKYLSGDLAIGSSGHPTQVTKVMRRKYSGPMVKIQPKYLDSITCTTEHPIMVVPGGLIRFKCGQRKPGATVLEAVWKDAKDVKTSDFLIVPRLKSEPGSSSRIDLSEFNSQDFHNNTGLRYFDLSEEVAWMMGLYVAEGCSHHCGLNFSLHEKEIEIYQRLRSVFLSLGRSCARHSRNKFGSKGVEISVPCMALKRAFRFWFGHNARNKVIPEFIMRATPEIQRQFLIGLFAGDGYISGNKIHLHTASHTLAIQTQLLIASLGAMVGFSFCKPPSKQTRMKNGSLIKSGPSWQLRGTSPRLAEIFGYEYKFTRNPSEICIVEENRILVPIRSISTENYSGKVFNLETDHHTYLVSNAAVHNCHEHLEYYSLSVLERIMRMAKLKIFRAELNAINGGSIRCYVGYEENLEERPEAWGLELKRIRESEFDMELDTDKPYASFQSRIENHRDELMLLLRELKQAGKTIHLYGASTKGNTLLQWCGIDARMIDCAADRNPEKNQAMTLGTCIQIVSEEESRSRQPDYYLVLPWHFKDEFLKRERKAKAMTTRKSPKFIFPLPHVEIVELT
jgi:intein/homing endonuclease